MTDPPDEVDQLLQGGGSDERAPTASLLRRAATLPEATPAPDLLAAMAHETRSVLDPSPHQSPKQSRRRSMFATKVATAAAAITLTAAGVAAADGSLPDAAQDGIAEAGSHIGLNLPDAASDDARDATTHDADAEMQADVEADTEVEASTETSSTEEERGNLTNPANADEHGETVSSIANDDTLSGREKGAAVSADASIKAEGDRTAPSDASPEGEGEWLEDMPARVEIPNEGDAAPVETPNGGEASADARAEAEVRFGS